MQPEVDNFLKFLPDRLADCAKKAGGKRALALATHISEAQLFRYISGKSEIPVNRLVAIALAAKVSPAWLLTGDAAVADGEPNRPPFREALLVNITQVLEELLIEYEKNFTPAQRAQAINFMYKALRHEEILRDIHLTITKPLMLGFVNFLVDIKNEDILIALNHAVDFFEYSHQNTDFNLHAGEFSAFVNHIIRAYAYYYDSASGRAYYDRTGSQILPHNAKQLDNIISTTQKSLGKMKLDVLDIGCGSARDMSYLHRHYDNISIHGTDQSNFALKICQDLIQREQLPQNSVVKSDLRIIPFPKERFDLLISRMSFYCLPYLPNSGLGVETLINEAWRSLKPNGLFYIVSRVGDGREYLPFCQYYNQVSFKNLIEQHGFELVWYEEENLKRALQTSCSHITVEDKYYETFRALIRKII